MAISLPISSAHAAKIGVVVIDVQKSFISSSANPNMPEVLANTRKVFELSEAHRIPFFITYEGRRTGDHDIPADLKRLLPSHQQAFTKTTYAATGLASFAQAIRGSGLSHFLVLGAETDVCVLQTVQGLRQMGYQVLLQKDAVFSSEPNAGPALRRLAASGAQFVGMSEVQSLLEGKSEPQSVGESISTIIEPFKEGRGNVAIVLEGLTEQNLVPGSDPFFREKLERLRELLLLSEWMELPVYTASGSYAIPPALERMISEPALEKLRTKRYRSLNGLPRGMQLMVAGSGNLLPQLLGKLVSHGQVFLLEDTSFGSIPATAIPLTYKSLFHGMIRGVNSAEWPSQEWVARDEEFSPLMKEPEALAPIGGPGGKVR